MRHLKIHKVEEKKMDIHRKQEKKVRDLRRERTSSFNHIRNRVRDSGASIDMARASLYTMGRKKLREMDGGEEISDSMELMGMATGTVYGASRTVKKAAGKGSYRSKGYRSSTHDHDSRYARNDVQKSSANAPSERIAHDEQSDIISGRNNNAHDNETFHDSGKRKKDVYGKNKKADRKSEYSRSDHDDSRQRRNDVKKRKNAREKKAKGESNTTGKSSRYSVRSRMIASYIANLNREEQQTDMIHAAKETVKREAILVIKRIMATILPAVTGSVAMVALVAGIIMMLLAVIYQSPFAIFFPKIDTGCDDIRMVLSSYYMDFNKKVMAIEQSGDSVTYQNKDNGTPVSNYKDTLMVYMILYGDGKAAYVMDDEGKKNLKKVFDEMNYIDSASSATPMEVGDSIGEVWVTAYCSCSICCGPYANGITASGKKATAKHTIAVDAYHPIVPMGTKVVIEGTVYTVEDTGDLNHYGNDFDVYFSDHNLATQFGRRHVEAFIAEGNTNTVTVISSGSTVHNLTYQDYINKGTMNEDQKMLLTELMSSDLWDQYYGDNVGEEVAQMALTKVGCGYSQDRRYDEGWYDCSSLVYRLYKEVGIELPTVASTQGQYCFENAMIINKDELRPGDIIFYSTEENGEFRNITHVAIYVGEGMMVHASNPTRGVVLDPLRTNNVVFYARPYN